MNLGGVFRHRNCSDAENSFLYQYVTSQGFKTAYFGFKRDDDGETWSWSHDESNDYTDWHSDEPNNENGNENWAEFYWKFDDGTWNDGDFGNGTNSDDTAYICEWG
ncbi:lectin-like protein [Bifidobacterium tibiigranuli]|uniref:lectin-like protein n=1 Tax=Bifidobacterium tibiigranuli TaxID=2172043 RepID=UPI0026EF12E8|nr:lectin-like protein [Bifidobacterium tibiigranuli]MCI1712631.1 hypothetical protein [Bifidobacterium tibiigranuli]